MNRKKYFDYIEGKLTALSYRIKERGKLNLLEFNIHSETFFADLCNKIFDYKLININAVQQNAPGIDLVDDDNRIVAQVSSTCTKSKIESSLNKEIYKNYKGYSYKFIPIVDCPNALKGKEFINPYKLEFDPKQDILDLKTILSSILVLRDEKLLELFEFVKQELGEEIDHAKVPTNLAFIVNILANEISNIRVEPPETEDFSIEDKIEFNNLASIRGLIVEYSIYNSKMDSLYTEYDRQGKNKSHSVLQYIRAQYHRLKSLNKKAEEIFFQIKDNLIPIIENSSNYKEIALEELEYCVYIIIVDAFIRCKIFENPRGYSHVITR